MKNKLKTFGGFLWRILKDIIVGIFTYIFLVIDRIIMAPFPIVSCYSAQELGDKPDRHLTNLVLRVSVFLIGFGIFLLIKWIL